MKILFSGGGTMGPVTPLLAVVEAWREQDPTIEYVWVGTPHGPEQGLIEEYAIPFFSLPVARIPRYLSWEWVVFPFLFVYAFLCACWLIYLQKPDLIGTAGGYTSVPLVLAGRCFCVPAWLHQQDVQPILTSRILTPFVQWITVAFEQTLSSFPQDKTSVMGNPVRGSLFSGSIDSAMTLFQLNKEKPTLLVYGGGTGATWLNQAMEVIAPALTQTMNVIHVTGRGKQTTHHKLADYHAVEFLSGGMKHAYAAADLVVSRAGMGAITELSALSKAAILIPLPRSAQEQNLQALGDAVEVFSQNESPSALLDRILLTMNHPTKRIALGRALHTILRTNAADELAQALGRLAKNKHTP